MEFRSRIAVVTGGGAGMGREFAMQLAAKGCHVALCDVSAGNLESTKAMIVAASPPRGTKVTTHVVDVSDVGQVETFRDEVVEQMGTDRIHLLINNAGVTGGASMIETPRDEWERTFNICWGGVYFGVRTFLPLLMAADRACIVNMSSVSGFWASVGPTQPHTAYSAAKFAVKGFTEALITDLRLHAPHVTCAVVMPGLVGTDIGSNSRKLFQPVGGESDEVRSPDMTAANSIKDQAPTTAAQAVTTILDGVRAGRWRILVGEDAILLDQQVRVDPERAYDEDFAGMAGFTKILAGQKQAEA